MAAVAAVAGSTTQPGSEFVGSWWLEGSDGGIPLFICRIKQYFCLLLTFQIKVVYMLLGLGRLPTVLLEALSQTQGLVLVI